MRVVDRSQSWEVTLSEQETPFQEPQALFSEPESEHPHTATAHESDSAMEHTAEHADNDAAAPDSESGSGAATDAEQRRREKMAHTRAAKMAELFDGKKYSILGEIHLSEDEQFQTPFGNRGRHGYVIKESTTGTKIMVGETVLRKAAAQYDAIVGLPPEKPKRHRRTKAEKAADDARKAAEAAENQARILARFEQEHSVTV